MSYIYLCVDLQLLSDTELNVKVHLHMVDDLYVKCFILHLLKLNRLLDHMYMNDGSKKTSVAP
jgi:hypothetical protein